MDGQSQESSKKLWFNLDEMFALDLVGIQCESGLVSLNNDALSVGRPEIGNDIPHELLCGVVRAIDSGTIGHDLLRAVWQESAKLAVALDQEPQFWHRKFRMARRLMIDDGIGLETSFGTAQELLEKLERALAWVWESKVNCIEEIVN